MSSKNKSVYSSLSAAAAAATPSPMHLLLRKIVINRLASADYRLSGQARYQLNAWAGNAHQHHVAKSMCALSRMVVQHQAPRKKEAAILDGHHDWIAEKIGDWLQQKQQPITALVDIGGGRGDMARLLNAKLGGGLEACVCVEPAGPAGWDYSTAAPAVPDTVTFCPWVQGEDMAVPDASADLVLIMVALHHMTPEAADAAVRNAYRILRPGGLLLLKEHDIVSPADRAAVDWEHHMYHVMATATGEAMHEQAATEYFDAYVGNFRSKEAWNQHLASRGFALEHDFSRLFDPLPAAATANTDPRNVTKLYWQVWRKFCVN